ncbi:unnamed protein product [Prunus brigantina]
MMFPKFWTQSDIDWSMKSDNSVSSEMEWLVYSIDAAEFILVQLNLHNIIPP